MLAESLKAPRFRYSFVCRDKNGAVKWSETFDNLVTTPGKNFLLDTVFAGVGYTASWFMGLVTATGFSTFAASDTLTSHAGWSESTNYSNANRVTLAFSAASGGSKSTSSGAVFNVNASDTIEGAFIATNNTKGGTTGTLYSAGAFSSARSVSSGDTLTVSATLSC